MQLSGYPVAVVGGGISGLAAAVALAQRGAQVRVFEQAPLLEEVGAGLQVGPNGYAVLEALGIASDVEALSSHPQAIELRNGVSGGLLMQFPLGPSAVARYGRPYLHVHRADLHVSLMRAARSLDVEIVTGARVVDIEDSAEGGRLKDHLGQTIAEAPLVLGADGVRSRLRKALVGDQGVTFTGQVAYRGTVPEGALPKGFVPKKGVLYSGSGRHVVIYPLRGGNQINFIAVEERDTWTDDGWNLPASKDDLMAAFDGWCPEVRQVLSACPAPFLWGLFAHPVLPKWQDGRMVLLGDAAHPMLPFLAQGACMGLEDAYVLADCLERASTQADGLAQYEALRKPRATKVQAASTGQAALYHLPDGPKRQIMHTGMKLVDRVMPSFGLSRMDWLYGHDVTA